jgi:hypothetical protein
MIATLLHVVGMNLHHVHAGTSNDTAKGWAVLPHWLLMATCFPFAVEKSIPSADISHFNTSTPCTGKLEQECKAGCCACGIEAPRTAVGMVCGFNISNAWLQICLRHAKIFKYP